jgi:hypothetical protein
MNSNWENFLAAASILAVSGPIKNRLIDAYTKHLAFLRAEELPREVRDDFASLEKCLSSVSPLRGETAIQATVRKMSDQEASTQAQRILSLLGTMIRMQLQPRQPILRAVNGISDSYDDVATAN